MRLRHTHYVEQFKDPHWERRFYAYCEADANDAAVYLRNCGHEARVVKLEDANV